MNVKAESLLDEMAINEPTLEAALSACGWEQSEPTCHRLHTRSGPAFLLELPQRDRWRQFYLSGGKTPVSSNSRLLHDNHRLVGPAKLVDGPGDCSICRLDVPDDLTGTIGTTLARSDDTNMLDPHLAWAQAVSSVATYRSRRPTTRRVSNAQLAAQLQQAGWSVSADDDRLSVHFQLPGVYRQLTIEQNDRAGVTLAVELIDLTDVADDCLRAMLLLANAANARLPLVRMAVAESSTRITLRAEVNFGARFIGGSFLLQSLHAIENAVGRTARELEALRDVELARLVLSAAAKNSQSPD
jgi:hypothetical protein